MANVRLRNKPEDYVRMGINPKFVEPWEDGRRNTDDVGCIEWWYFDADLEDGTRIGVNFATNPIAGHPKKGYHPFFYYAIQFPDGDESKEFFFFEADECSFGDGTCNVRVGPHSIVGDLNEYHIHLEPVSGIGFDLKLEKRVSSWRPGTAYVDLHDPVDNADRFFTWLCAVPRGDVSGTLTRGGNSFEVRGTGYHDHQWANGEVFQFWNRWLWGRQQSEDYTIVLFELVSTERTGHVRFPWFFVQDKDGKIIFDNSETDGFACEVLETYVEEKSGKRLPRVSRYTFKSDDMTIEYLLTETGTIVFNDHYATVPEAKKAEYDAIGAQPTYTRYTATGDLTITKNGKTTEVKGELLYEISSQYREYLL